jgi:hypothetical protein
MGNIVGNLLGPGSSHHFTSTFPGSLVKTGVVEALLVGPWLQASGVAPAPLSSYGTLTEFPHNSMSREELKRNSYAYTIVCIYIYITLIYYIILYNVYINCTMFVYTHNKQ